MKRYVIWHICFKQNKGISHYWNSLKAQLMKHKELILNNYILAQSVNEEPLSD